MAKTKFKITTTGGGIDGRALNNIRVEQDGSLYEVRTPPPASTLLAASNADPPVLTFSLNAPSGTWNWTLSITPSSSPLSGNWSNTDQNNDTTQIGSWTSESVPDPYGEAEEEEAAAAS